MGHYTHLRVRGTLNTLGHRVWLSVYEHESWGYAHRVVMVDGPDELLLEFAQLPRSRFIPFGGVMDEDWGKGFDNLVLDASLVQFACSVKGQSEILFFVTRLIPVLFDSVETCQTMAEEAHAPTTWQFENNKLVAALREERGCDEP